MVSGMSKKNFGGLTPEQLAMWDKKNNILKLESTTDYGIVKLITGWMLGVIMTAPLMLFLNECVEVEISYGDPPKVYHWNEITQERGKEVK